MRRLHSFGGCLLAISAPSCMPAPVASQWEKLEGEKGYKVQHILPAE